MPAGPRPPVARRTAIAVVAVVLVAAVALVSARVAGAGHRAASRSAAARPAAAPRPTWSGPPVAADAAAAGPVAASRTSAAHPAAGRPSAGPAMAAAPVSELLSQGMAAIASSTQSAAYLPASAAVDGDPGTRWASAASDPQWLRVDLGATDHIRRVVLDWEAAYARAFKIQVSRTGRRWTTIYATTAGTGGTQRLKVSGTGRYVRMYGTARGTGYGYSLWEFRVYGTPGPAAPMPGMPMPMPAPPFRPNLDPGESVILSPAVRGIAGDPNFVPPSYVTHHEFQTDCSVTRNRQVDPIVYPRMAVSAHMHTFMGAATTSQDSTTGSLSRSTTSCVIPQDHSAYWFPTLYNGRTAVMPVGPQVIYYKSGVTDYRTVRPFPRGLRFVVGNDRATEAEFRASRGTVEGWECGNSSFHWNFPRHCPAGSELNIRYQAPSCWDGVHLDTPDHTSQMAYPIHIGGKLVCPPGHPVAVPMLEFKMAFPVSGNLSRLHLASGPGYTWHYDFFDAWNPTVLSALVRHCINQGLQCDTHGYDLYLPRFGAVLGPDYRLLPGR
jgi:Domain of unknown function (DUF1996)/F5/8 type C domain